MTAPTWHASGNRPERSALCGARDVLLSGMLRHQARKGYTCCAHCLAILATEVQELARNANERAAVPAPPKPVNRRPTRRT